MDSTDFFEARKQLNKTQKDMAALLGVSLKAIHSYEQGWRTIPPHAERQTLFLLHQNREKKVPQKPCWIVKKCPPSRKKQCPAYEFKMGTLCWLINGTICECKTQTNWEEKMIICRKCESYSLGKSA